MTDSIRAAAERLQQAWDEHGNKWPTHHEDAWNAALHEFFDVLTAQPPLIDTPLDLDELLSPKGAYERGTGHEDGAQLVDQLEWWAPAHGCDTLENLLDRIRSRILPHLRPPIAGIDVPGVDGDYGGLQELCDAEGVDVRIGAPLLRRAREAWGSPAPAPASDADSLQAIAVIAQDMRSRGLAEQAAGDELLKLANDRRAAQPPAPAPASDGEREEREELARWLEQDRGNHGIAAYAETRERLERAATLLLQPAPAPAAVPVSVSERLPEPNVKVLAHYYNGLGKGRTVCAIWVPAKTRSDSYSDDDFTEYDEESDNFYWPEGWYEAIENWEDLGWVKVDEGEVVYWQPLPKWPAYAIPLPAPQGGEVGE